MARYSLANYTLAITLPSELATILGLTGSESLVVGVEGSYLDTFAVELDNDMFSTKGDATGSWVHDKNLSRVGKAEISLNQLSDRVAKFKKIVNIYYQSGTDYDGVNLSLVDNQGNEIANCVDCYFIKIPRQEFGQESGNQTWSLTCGQITFSD